MGKFLDVRGLLLPGRLMAFVRSKNWSHPGNQIRFDSACYSEFGRRFAGTYWGRRQPYKSSEKGLIYRGAAGVDTAETRRAAVWMGGTVEMDGDSTCRGAPRMQICADFRGHSQNNFYSVLSSPAVRMRSLY